jgi:non-canonical (house-cleaning) NTP pyrophosphatase
MFNLGMLGVEAQQVMLLRMFKITNDGMSAGFEMNRMVTEKIFAAAEAGARMMQGASTDSIVRGYRKKVRANASRLRRGT